MIVVLEKDVYDVNISLTGHSSILVSLNLSAVATKFMLLNALMILDLPSLFCRKCGNADNSTSN